MFELSEGDNMISVEEMEENLISGFNQTTARDRAIGMAWYPIAHDFAHVIGRGNVMLGAGLLAAMSPNKSWNENRRLAVHASMGEFFGHFSDSLNKARRIYAGEDPATVLPMHKKTGHFYANIANPDDMDFVTIDRHAIRAATLDWDNGSPRATDKQYGSYVQAYSGAAWRVGMRGCDFQAVLWGWARNR